MTIFLYYDCWDAPGGIATYIHALAIKLHASQVPFQLAICEGTPSPLADELVAKGIKVYRQRKLPGDRFQIRKKFMLAWLERQLSPRDWVFCVCQPEPAIYLKLVRLVHRRRAKIGVSWMLTPEFWPLSDQVAGAFVEETRQAIFETDAVVSTSECSVHQYKEVYGYTGRVYVVPYHNLLFFTEVVPLPPEPPWKIGFMGRLDIHHKNLDTLLHVMAKVRQVRQDVELHLYGGGQDEEILKQIAFSIGAEDCIYFHGAYDHRRDLRKIISNCHFFVYASRLEGGPCFSLLELTQAGRYCVASDVGGIPDLYRGYPDVGLLVDNDADSIYRGLIHTLEKLEDHTVDPEKIRARYFDGFDMESVHQVWNSVFNATG